MRSFIIACVCLFVLSEPRTGLPQPAQTKKSVVATQQNYDPPKSQKPDEATLKQIADKSEALRLAITELKHRKIADDVLIEVEIYLKAAENIVRFGEWYHAASGKWALTTLDQGLERAKQASGGTAVWHNARGKWIVRAYRSSVDGAIQPYAVMLPHDYDSKPNWRLDVVLHGRDASLTEAKFIATHNGNAPKELGYVQLEVYGRGNNAYRWAGEADVFEAMEWFRFGPPELGRKVPGPIDPRRIVLRGFSMGGAGTWHIGLHHPDHFCVIGPGAGFTTTRGYVGNLPQQLPDYVEKCLHIYDAVDYAEDAFNVPVVAYSGENDPQKKAATNIETALSDFKELLRFTHLIAPGLEHQMPKEWQEKAETEYRKYADEGRATPDRVRFVTYTPKFGRCDWVQIDSLRTTFERAIVDGTRKGNTFDVTTRNIRRMTLSLHSQKEPLHAKIDGQEIDTKAVKLDSGFMIVELTGDTWAIVDNQKLKLRLHEAPEKRQGLQGPIDDAFTSKFVVVKPGGEGFHAATDKFVSDSLVQFASVWDKYFRGTLPVQSVSSINSTSPISENLVLYGDPQSNALIARLLPMLPITWTREKLVVNGVEYDAATHVPVMIYPNPISPDKYLVLNCGHTFKEADLKGTNALLYPRLGDWAVIKHSATAENSQEYEVVAAGLFDENWQFSPTK